MYVNDNKLVSLASLNNNCVRIIIYSFHKFQPKLKICHHEDIQKTYSGKIIRHLLRDVDCQFQNELGTSPPEATTYYSELNGIAEHDYSRLTYVQ